MTRTGDEPIVQKRIVVVFDICSSSNMLEDLILSQNEMALRNLMIAIKKDLQSEAPKRDFEVYKFIGDGWILLFPSDVAGTTLIEFLEHLCRVFKRKLKKYVLPHLQTNPPVMGLTFGIDRGDLIKIKMLGQQEYIGRPLNIASRLQSAIKEKDKHPSYKVLLSKSSFNALRLEEHRWKSKAVTRTLRNIQGGNKYACVKLELQG